MIARADNRAGLPEGDNHRAGLPEAEIRRAGLPEAEACAAILNAWIDATPWMPRVHPAR